MRAREIGVGVRFAVRELIDCNGLREKEGVVGRGCCMIREGGGFNRRNMVRNRIGDNEGGKEEGCFFVCFSQQRRQHKGTHKKETIQKSPLLAPPVKNPQRWPKEDNVYKSARIEGLILITRLSVIGGRTGRLR